MGAKYTTNAASGYNSSPPSDDASQTASNLITWAKHKEKLGDPLKTLAEAINTDLVAAFDYAVRRITTSDSLVAGDHMRTVEIGPSVSTIVTVTLADAATMTNVYRVYIKNSGTKECTIARATGADTIDGSAANISIPAGSSYLLTTNNAANGYLIAGCYPLEVKNLTEEEAPAVSDTVAIYDLSAAALRKTTLSNLSQAIRAASDTATGIIEIATQAEQETGSDTTRAVTPGRQQFHPSAAKVWIKCNFSGATQASYNVASITDDGVGLLTVSIATDFSSADYTIVGLPLDGGTTAISIIVTNQAAGTFGPALRTSANALADASNWMLACFGDQ